MRTLISSLFLLSIASCGVESEAASPRTLHVETEHGLTFLEGPRTILPRVTRSEVVTRPAIGRFGVTFEVNAGASDFSVSDLQVSAVVHGPDERVIDTPEGLLIAGEPRLVQRAEDHLAHLARQDGNWATGTMTLSGGSGSLVLLGEGAVRVEGETHEIPAGTSGALVFEMPREGLALEVDALDQAVLCEVRPATLVATQPSREHPELVEAGSSAILSFDPPTVGEDQAWTLVVEAPRVSVGYRTTGQVEAASKAAPLVDVAQSIGIDFVHMEGPDEQLDIRPTMGPGVAWGDVDGDGWVDLYLVQGGGREGSDVPSDRLYRNLGDGNFQDITVSAGLSAERGAGMGVLLVDLDGDADLDLYLANYGDDELWENDGKGNFTRCEDAFDTLGLWSAGVCAADIEGDGDLDLYVTGYLDYDPAKMPDAPELGSYRREDPIEMLPFAFPGERNRLLLNEGGLKFTDVTEERGLIDVQGRGMQPIFWDFDRDGDMDLYVANDVSFNVLFRNEGDGSFTDVSFATGLDDPRGGMGVALGDVDRDGDEDLFLTNWQLEANALYENLLSAPYDARHRRSNFHDSTVRSGLGPAGMGATAWGAVFFDLERDGDLDLFVANGYTSPDYQGTGICVGQPNHLFVATREARFEQRLDLPDLQVPLASRAAAGCDYDRDGDLDLVVSANNGRVQLLRNEASPAGHWLGVILSQEGKNPAAIGAEVTLHSGDEMLRRSITAGTSYLACEPAEAYFGLGELTQVTAEVRWPDGDVTRHELEGVDRWVTLER